ncbi:hypothetical protein [Endozoicomonas euniceicola]|uniref:Secreted protein n=1 Tax=Endozoicomonas euniceicola TaxID=1234143 RepID=A0ABY6H173_9GAMM|nr:hypothetical protein [Endozoicomonas euniceicola]UYM17899.1 hypothetical protein NX720_08325 [Endozoicomonas euniceicola]
MEKFIKIAAMLTVFFISLARADIQEQLKPPVEYEIIHDPDIKGIYQNEKESLSWFDNELEERKSAEIDGKPYKTKALKITLQNLKGFTQHILDGKQFREELKNDERNAYNQLQSDLGKVDTNQPEYLETIKLSEKLALLYNLSVIRHVDEIQRLNYLTLLSRTLPGEYEQPSYTALYNMPPSLGLMELAEQTDILLLPGFEPLSISDFVGFCHLRLYPLGLTSSYIAKADGENQSPYAFFGHDEQHATLTAQHKGLREPFNTTKSILNFKKLVFNEGRLFFKGDLNIMSILKLSLFITTHEAEDPEKPILPDLHNQKSLEKYFREILFIRKYSAPEYRAIPNDDIIRAVVWFAAVYDFWQSNDKPAQMLKRERLAVMQNFLIYYNLYNPLLKLQADRY